MWQHLQLLSLLWIFFANNSIFLSKVYNSAAFRKFTVLCNHHLYVGPKHFHHLCNTEYQFTSHSPFPAPPALTNQQSAFWLYGSAYVGYVTLLWTELF